MKGKAHINGNEVGDKWYNLRYILKVKLREFASGFNVSCEKFHFQHVEFEISITHSNGDTK